MIYNYFLIPSATKPSAILLPVRVGSLIVTLLNFLCIYAKNINRNPYVCLLIK